MVVPRCHRVHSGRDEKRHGTLSSRSARSARQPVPPVKSHGHGHGHSDSGSDPVLPPTSEFYHPSYLSLRPDVPESLTGEQVTWVGGNRASGGGEEVELGQLGI